MPEESKAPKKVAAAQMGGGGQAPTIPSVPLVARTVSPQIEIIYRNMMGAVMTADEPAQAALTAVATRRWGDLAMELGLGTRRPTKVHVGLDESKSFLYLAPTTKDDPAGIDVRYGGGRVQINLITVFAPLERYVQPGRREFYDVNITPAKVAFDDGFESISLYVYLKPTKEEPRRSMSEESKAKRRATLARKKQQRLNGDASTITE